VTPDADSDAEPAHDAETDAPGEADRSLSFDDLVAHVAQDSLLTQRQAQAYVARDLADLGREETADRLGISPNVVDDHIAIARRKVKQARETVERLDEIDAAIDAPTAHGRRRDE